MLESLFNKVADPKFYNFIKKRLQHRCFPVNIAKFLKTPYFEEHLRTAAISDFLNFLEYSTLLQYFPVFSSWIPATFSDKQFCRLHLIRQF